MYMDHCCINRHKETLGNISMNSLLCLDDKQPHNYICQVSGQRSCIDACLIWTCYFIAKWCIDFKEFMKINRWGQCLYNKPPQPNTYTATFNSVSPSDVMWHHWSCSTFVKFNGVLPNDTADLLEQMPIRCRLETWEQISKKFKSNSYMTKRENGRY